MDNFLSKDEFGAFSTRYDGKEGDTYRPTEKLNVEVYINRTVMNTPVWEKLERWLKYLERYYVRSTEDMQRLLSAYQHLDEHAQSLQRQVNLLQSKLPPPSRW